MRKRMDNVKKLIYTIESEELIMRKSIKKLTALLATGVLVFGALGCGSSKEKQKEVKEETKKTENVLEGVYYVREKSKKRNR